jgi:spore maturation protein CgeB
VKVLLVGAGAGYSTKDLEMGFYEAFEELGVDLSFYLLDRRLFIAREWLLFQWKKFLGSNPDRKPGWHDVIYRGSIEALEMALRYDVDFVLLISGMYFHLDVVVMLKRAGFKVGCLFTESPYLDDQQSRLASMMDVSFTNERTSVEYLRQFCKNTHYLRHAYSPQRHAQGPTSQQREAQQLSEWMESNQNKGTVELKAHDVVFVGTGFRERIDILAGVDWTGIDLGLYGNWTLLPSRHKLRRYLRGGTMTNMDAHALYQQAKIGLNLYRTSKDYTWDGGHIEGAESMNPRAYELAAAGIFSLTQYRNEAEETLSDSQPFFFGSAGLEALVKTYLRGDNEDFVGEARELVNGHTFVERAKQVLEHAIS